MNSGLILVDIQNDYFPNGAMALHGMEQAAGKAEKVLQKFRRHGRPVFHVRHISNRPGATFFLPGTKGSEIYPGVAPKDGEVKIEKNFPNGFRDTDLLPRLQQAAVEEVVICGAMSHMCIDATTRAAADFGFQCVVIDDACATRDLEFRGDALAAGLVHSAFMAALSGSYARMLTAAEFDLRPT